MAIKLSELIEAARYRNGLWSKLRQPHGAIMRHTNTVQRSLFQHALLHDPQYMAQKLAFVIKADDYADYPATESGGTVTFEDSATGDLVEFEAGTQWDSGMADATSTTTTLADSVKAWTTNAYVGKYAHILLGTGKGQWRKIVSNTGTVLTIDSAYPFTIVPDATSLYEIVTLSMVVDGDAKLTEGIGPVTTAPAFSVKVNTSGQAYIATDEPISLPTRSGIVLPDHYRVIGGSLFRAGEEHDELCLTTYELRHQPPRRPAAYLLGGALYLIDPGGDYATDDVVEVQYVPVPPGLTATTDYLLAPEGARPYLEWEACVALELSWPTGSPAWGSMANEAKKLYLTSLSANRPRITRVKEVW